VGEVEQQRRLATELERLDEALGGELIAACAVVRVALHVQRSRLGERRALLRVVGRRRARLLSSRRRRLRLGRSLRGLRLHVAGGDSDQECSEREACWRDRGHGQSYFLKGSRLSDDGANGSSAGLVFWGGGGGGGAVTADP